MQNYDLECPYCGAGNNVCHDDGFGYEENELHEIECIGCDKYFVFTTTIHFSYDAYTADCLNGGKHQYEKTKTFPERYTKLRCKMCGDEKPLDGEN
jgi:hypothetical protein